MACDKNGANCIHYAHRSFSVCSNDACLRRPNHGIHKQTRLCPVCFHLHLERLSADKNGDVWPPCRCAEHLRLVKDTQRQYDDEQAVMITQQQYNDEHAPTFRGPAMIQDAPTFGGPEMIPQPRTQLAPQNLASPPPGMFVGAQAAQAQSAEEPQQPLPPAPAHQVRVKVPPPAMPPKLNGASSSSRDPMEAVPIQGVQAHIAALEAKIDTLTAMVQTLIDKNNLDGMC